MKRRTFIPGLMCLVSLLFIFVIIPAQTKELHVPGDLEPAVFPTAAMLVIAVLSGILTVQEWKRENGREKGFEAGDLMYLLAVGAMLLAYVILLDIIGYYVTTAAAMILTLRKYDCMKWSICLTSTAAFLALCYLLFEVGLRISLPRGFLI